MGAYVPMLNLSGPQGWLAVSNTMSPLTHQKEDLRSRVPKFNSLFFFALERLLRHEILPFSLGIFAPCPKKQSYHIQEGWGSNGRETGTVPTDVLPRGDSQGPGTNTV